jgi:PKD repeat protein
MSKIRYLHVISRLKPHSDILRRPHLLRWLLRFSVLSCVYIGLALISPNHATAEVSLTTPSGISLSIHDTEYGSISVTNLIQDWPQLCVQAACPQGDCVPCESAQLYHAQGTQSLIELSGRQRVTSTAVIEGIEVNRLIYVPIDGPQESDAFLRIVDSFYNPTTQPQSVSVSLGSLHAQSTVGSIGSQIWRTSSYDVDFNLDDRWVLIDDDQADEGQDNVVVLFRGAGGEIPDMLSHDEGSRTMSWRYNEMTIPARQRVNLITVIQVEPSRVQALSEVRSLLRFRPADVTFGLDTLNRRAIYNVDIDPDNTCPLADLNGPYSGNEGQAVQLSGASSFDLEGASLIYRWDLDNDGIFGEPGQESEGANILVTYPQDGTYPVSLEVQDSLGKTDRDHVLVNVRNVRPLMNQLLTNSPINEGGVLEVMLEGSDVGVEDQLNYAIDWEGNGVFENVGMSSSHRYTEDGTISAQAKVFDNDGGSTIVPLPIIINNLPPSIQQVIANNPSNEGAEVRFVVQAVDPGQDPLTYRFDFDDDGVFEESNAFGEATMVYPEDGSYNTTIEVVDHQGAATQYEYPISVRNVAPVLNDLTMNGEPIEGSSVNFIVNASDAGIFDLLTYEFDLDGQEGFEISQSASSLNYSFPDSGIYQVKVRVMDDESAFATRTMEVNVANLPPSGTLRFEGTSVREGLVATADQGRTFEVIATGSDPSEIDVSTLSFNWDLNQDGVYELLSSDARQNLHFDQEGAYLIRCLIRDKDFGETVVEREIMIAGRPPELIDFTVESEGPHFEGTPVRFLVNANDSDPLTYSLDFDNDGIFDLESDEPNISWSFSNEGTYTVRVRVADLTGYVEDTISVEVLNAPPTIELNTGVNVGEGDDLTIFVTPRDPGEYDEITVTVTFQNQTEVVTLSPNQVTRFTLPTQDNGFIDINAQAVDDFGAESILYTARAFIENRPPFIPPFSPSPAHEGERYSQVIPADDPAGLNDSIFYSLIEPPANVEIEPFSGLLLWTPTYDDYVNSPITFELLIEDEDGGRLERSISIEVIAKDIDNDGIPDSYEAQTCERYSPCLSATNTEDAGEDPDQDGRSSLEEWELGTDPFNFEGPSVPRQLSPGAEEVVTQLPLNLTVSHVESSRPLPPSEDGSLSARMIYLEYELYADGNLEALIEASDLIDMDSISEDEINSWRPDSDNFIEDQLYWWRVRATDGPAVTAWSALSSFRINTENQPPESPTLLLPMNGSIVSDLTPTLSFNPSVDPDRESVYFVVRGYRESPDGLVVDFGGQVQSEVEGGALSFTLNNRLQENARYQWDVVAIDEVGLESPSSERWSFVVDLENEPPTEPTLISPNNGDLITELRPIFQASGSIDQEGASVSYHFQVRAVGDSTVITESTEEGIYAEGGVAQWVPTEDLYEDQEHTVSLFASDGITQTGIVSATFFVSSEDNAPSKPVLLEPADNALVAPSNAVLIWSESRDPELGNVRYQVEYCSPQGDCQESAVLNNNSFTLEGLIPQRTVYTWRVRSFDEAGNSEGFSASRAITLSSPNTSNNQDDGGCQQPTGQPHKWPLFLIFAWVIITVRQSKYS